MVTGTHITKEQVLFLLEHVADPEVPVLSVIDLGIIRQLHISEADIEVVITPTYSGCPAMDVISMQIKMVLLENGFKKVSGYYCFVARMDYRLDECRG